MGINNSNNVYKAPLEIQSDLKQLVQLHSQGRDTKTFYGKMVDGKHGALVKSYLTQISKELARQKPDYMLPEAGRQKSRVETMPRDCFPIVAGMLDASDINAARCVNKLFLRNFKPLASERTERAQTVLNQIRGCTSITSIQNLRRQLTELKECLPQYLGQDKTWTMAEVLKLYIPSLKNIDLSHENFGIDDIRELLKAFEVISQTETPKEIVKMGKQAGVFAVDIPLGNRELLLDIAVTAGIFLAQDSIPQDMGVLWQEVVLKLLRRPNVEVAELLQMFSDRMILPAGDACIVYPPDHPIFGEIEVFNLGNENLELQLGEIKPFLESFCPKLKVLVMHIENQFELIEFHKFFLTTDRQNTLLRLQTKEVGEGSNISLYPDISQYVCQLVCCQSKLQEALISFPISNGRILLLLADLCPNITSLSLRPGTDHEKELFLSGIISVVEKCPRIKRVMLVGVNDRALENWRDPFRKLKNLRELCIYNNQANFSPKTVMRFLESCPSLQRLAFSGDKLSGNETPINDFVVSSLDTFHPELKELTILTNKNILSDYIVWDLVRRCRLLTKLWLNNERMVLQNAFRDVFQLRFINQQLQDKDVSHSRLLRDFLTLSRSAKESIYQGISWHFDIADAAWGKKKLLEEGPQLLARCVKAYTLYRGNLLEQQIQMSLAEIAENFFSNNT